MYEAIAHSHDLPPRDGRVRPLGVFAHMRGSFTNDLYRLQNRELGPSVMGEFLVRHAFHEGPRIARRK